MTFFDFIEQHNGHNITCFSNEKNFTCRLVYRCEDCKVSFPEDPKEHDYDKNLIKVSNSPTDP